MALCNPSKPFNSRFMLETAHAMWMLGLTVMDGEPLSRCTRTWASGGFSVWGRRAVPATPAAVHPCATCTEPQPAHLQCFPNAPAVCWLKTVQTSTLVWAMALCPFHWPQPIRLLSGLKWCHEIAEHMLGWSRLGVLLLPAISVCLSDSLPVHHRVQEVTLVPWKRVESRSLRSCGASPWKTSDGWETPYRGCTSVQLHSRCTHKSSRVQNGA